MSDAFWVAMSGVAVAALTGIFKLIQMQMLISREMAANAKLAQEERKAMQEAVNKVEATVEESAKKTSLLEDKTLQFQEIVLASDMFDSEKLKAMIAKRASGFAPLDP